MTDDVYFAFGPRDQHERSVGGTRIMSLAFLCVSGQRAELVEL